MASTSRCAIARPSRRLLAPLALVASLLSALLAPPAAVAADVAAPAPGSLEESQCWLRDGQVRLALNGLQAALERAPDALARARAAAALGSALLQANRLPDAERQLDAALAGPLQGRERASALLDLGNLQLARGRPAPADAAWAQAAQAAPGDAEIALAADLNRTRLLPVAQRLRRLQAAQAAWAALPASVPGSVRARQALNLGTQARDTGADGLALAWQALEDGRRQATAAGDDRLAAEALDALAGLYDAQQRPADALRLVEQGIAAARRADARDLLMNLEGRAARLLRAQGQAEPALAAYRRAVAHAEAVRSDIPVTYVDGRSSFRDTLEPLYLGLTDLLLRRASTAPGAERAPLLRQARDTVELIKQTELEDYLRDRCSVGSARNATAYVPPAGTALYYPIILPDRLELLVETAAGIERRSVTVAGDKLREQVLDFVAALRNGNPLRARAEALFKLLVAPVEGLLTDQHVHTLVVVPDGVLRMLPMGALHDGRRWLLQRLAVATVPGLSLTPAPREGSGQLQALIAGMSEPGPVVDKLSAEVIDAVLEPVGDDKGDKGDKSARQTRPATRGPELREALALPGVKIEIENIARVMPGTVLLDKGFTLAALQQQLRTRSHGVVHIASHGVFGDSADTTFIMTYDDLLTLDGLQSLLRSDRPGSTPVELITLSACQTAEGDDRAPLGMSGTALKARARSALGTLWPVSDDAAHRVMSGFYKRLAEGGRSRVQALREAQLELLALPNRQHPFYWAPFILIGDWQ